MCSLPLRRTRWTNRLHNGLAWRKGGRRLISLPTGGDSRLNGLTGPSIRKSLTNAAVPPAGTDMKVSSGVHHLLLLLVVLLKSRALGDALALLRLLTAGDVPIGVK